MSWGFVAVAGATLVGSAIAADAAGDAADTQADAAREGSAEQARQFNAMRELLAPYREGGEEALQAQRALIGLAGQEEQQAAIEQLQGSPQFAALTQQGEESILQNASATGGLRGGNTQSALAQFRPQLLSNLINQQYQNLGGLTSVGQNAAAMTGNAGMQTAANQASLMNQAAAAQAGGQIAQANIASQGLGNLAGLGAMYMNRPQGGGGKF